MKVLFTLAVLWVLGRLWTLLEILYLAILIAVTLEPLVRRLERHIPRKVTLVLTALFMFGGVAAIILLIGSPLIEQLGTLFEKLPTYTKSVTELLPDNALVQKFTQKLIAKSSSTDPMSWVPHIFTFGQAAVETLSELVLMLVFSIYLLADGARAYRWVLAFFPAASRSKLDQTAHEVSDVISAYVAGQAICSFSCALFVFILLELLHVPNALVVGLLAGMMDVMPVLGFIMSIIPAMIFSLAVSPSTALFVLVGFIGYHVFENYFLVPTIYGNRLRVSTLTVLISLIAGGLLAGIPGAIAILPLVASYPIVERIWLSDALGSTVILKHASNAKKEEKS
jgi:predicted PurR-regulated permease PerM